MNQLDSTSPSPLIGPLLRLPAEAVHRRILADLHDAGFTDLVLAHFAVIRYPGPDGRRPLDLAREAGISKQAMNYLLGDLERLGYLTRDDDPDDGRSKRVQLTERGQALRPAIGRIVRRVEAELEEELGRTEFAQLRRLLIELNETSMVRELRDDF